jgi:S1-C subfamily serine protease
MTQLNDNNTSRGIWFYLILITSMTIGSVALAKCMSHADLPNVLERVTPAVVHIKVNGIYQNKEYKPFSASGTGVIIDSAHGYIATNHHVIENGELITVTLKDGRRFIAVLVGSDPLSDIALLQIKADNLVAIDIADSDKLRVGEPTIAIGGPYGLIQTVTTGIISALNRSMKSKTQYKNYIQTDADINSGNSGGALLNSKGELIGINTAIISPNGGGSAGLGFAIPSNQMHSLVKQMIKFGAVKRGSLGISGKSVDHATAESLGLSRVQGVLVEEVHKGSSASRAVPDSERPYAGEGSCAVCGLLPGDVIVSFNGMEITSYATLRTWVSYTPTGTTIQLGVIRGGIHFTFSVKL